MNPGNPSVTNYIVDVVLDVVKNYDVDGIHFDDYFYAYGGTPDELDQTEFDLYAAGMDRGDWRRNNVNQMIDSVSKAIMAEKPWIKFGVSPFGIYKNGVPSGIVGMDAYSEIYCDPLTWIEEGSVDYITPQLYWPTGGAQDFETLTEWWSGECKKNNRHFYAGQGAYRLPDPVKATRESVDVHELKYYFDNASMLEIGGKGTDDPVATWTVDEIGNQIDIIRANKLNNALGSVFLELTILTGWEIW